MCVGYFLDSALLQSMCCPFQVVTILLEAGADRSIVNNNDQTPYALATNPAVGR